MDDSSFDGSYKLLQLECLNDMCYNLRRGGIMKNVFLFDVETTGLSYKSDQIIEIGFLLLDTQLNTIKEQNFLIKYHQPLPEKIIEITGITNDMLLDGIEEAELAHMLNEIIDEDTLLVAYNAHFDVNFLKELLNRYNFDYLNNDVLDVMVVYKERYDYPHRLLNAIDTLGLQEEVINSHRALDDAKATLAVLKILSDEEKTLKYKNMISFNPKYPPKEGDKIPKMRYEPYLYRRKNSFFK